MGTRGRTSSASLEVVQNTDVLATPRPKPPSELTDEQRKEWNDIVNQLPADWFPRETYGLLAQYCRHIVASRRVAELINAIEQDDSFNVESYDRLLKMQEREGRAIASLATKMRLSQQTTYDKSKKKPRQSAKPWQG